MLWAQQELEKALYAPQARDLESFSLTMLSRSQFINKLLGRDAMLVGHDISSCTSTLQYAIVDNPSPRKGHRVIIVDTPGFINNAYHDVEVLKRIARWLASS